MTEHPREAEFAAAQLGRALGLATLSGLVGAFAALAATGAVPWWSFPLALFLAAWAVLSAVLLRVLIPDLIAATRAAAADARRTRRTPREPCAPDAHATIRVIHPEGNPP